MARSEWSIIFAPLRSIFRQFWHEAQWLLAGVAGVVLVSALAEVAAPFFFSRLLDTMEREFDYVALAWLFVGYAVLLGVANSLQSIVQSLSIMAAERLNLIAGIGFFNRLVKKRIAFFIGHNPAEIQSAQHKGQNALYGVLQLAIIVFLPGLTQFGLTLILLGATINIEIVLIVLVYGAAFITFTYFANKWTRPFLEVAIEASQENAKFVGNSVNAMETLRYFGSNAWISKQFAQKANESQAGWHQFAKKRIGYAAIFGAALAVQFAITFALLLPRYRAGELSLGDVVLFNTLLLQLNHPFQMIGFAIDDMVRSYSNFMPFARMWAAPEEPDAPTAGGLVLSDGKLVFEHLGFSYGDKPGLENVSFSAERGRVTFLTGETGVGKSTLFKLALKSLEPVSGRVLVDGLDLAGIARADWYSVIGVVPQEIMLLNDTFSANIVLGRAASPERLRAAATKASILGFIEGQPEGFDTIVGERGLRLSGGERQRIAIARALYDSPQVLFLDEASSALDEMTEAEIMAELRLLAQDMTILAITHRRTVIAAGDRVVQLTAGVAMESSGH